MKKILLYVVGFIFIITSEAFAFSVNWRSVFYDRRVYDPNYFSNPETEHIKAVIIFKDMTNPQDYTVEVRWIDHSHTQRSIELTLLEDWNPESNLVEFNKILETVDSLNNPNWPDSWDDTTYEFYVNNIKIEHASKFIPPRAFVPMMSVPSAIYDRSTNTVSWNDVSEADTYRVRVLTSDLHVLKYDSGSLPSTTTSFYFDIICPAGYAIRIEAWDTPVPNDTVINRSIYSTMALKCIADLNKDGRVDGLDFIIFRNNWGKICP